MFLLLIKMVKEKHENNNFSRKKLYKRINKQDQKINFLLRIVKIE